MNKEKYLSDLKQALVTSGCSSGYIDVCTHYAATLLNRGVPVIFDREHLSLLLGVSCEQLNRIVFGEAAYYRHATIPKKNGGERELDIPTITLKHIQRWILDNILDRIPTSSCSFGFKKHNSILDNASKHLGKSCVINMDIQDFFPSITFTQVFNVFSYYGYTKEVSFTLAKLCTYDGYLPQGSPASPYLSNVVCKKLDSRLLSLAETFHADYSRYADDLSFSGGRGIEKMIPVISSILEDEGFLVNQKKTRISYSHQKQEVTGLIVNGQSARVCRAYKREVKKDLYYCKKYGVSDHMKHIGCNKAFYKEHLFGKILFIKAIERNEGERLESLFNEIKWDY